MITYEPGCIELDLPPSYDSLDPALYGTPSRPPTAPSAPDFHGLSHPPASAPDLPPDYQETPPGSPWTVQLPSRSPSSSPPSTSKYDAYNGNLSRIYGVLLIPVGSLSIVCSAVAFGLGVFGLAGIFGVNITGGICTVLECNNYQSTKRAEWKFESIVAGLFGNVASRRRTKIPITSFLILCVITASFNISAFLLNLITLWILLHGHNMSSETYMRDVAMHLIALTLTLCGGGIAVAGSTLGLRVLITCCRPC